MITRERRRDRFAVTFALFVDHPVSVVGDFNGWDPFANPLWPRDDGARAATVALAPGRYAFRYLAEGGRFFDDPEADSIEANGIGDSHGVLDLPGVGAGFPAFAEAAPAPTAQPDALERIEGIGPKMADALRAAGITTFVQLAAASDDELQDALRAAGLRFAPSLATWSEQAGYLARGDEDGFRNLTDKLAAGRARKAR
jgi:hypothetical protein